MAVHPSGHAVTNDAMDEQPQEEFGELVDEMFEQDVQEDGIFVVPHTHHNIHAITLVVKYVIYTEMQDVEGQVQSLTNSMSYIYTTKAVALEYKIAKNFSMSKPMRNEARPPSSISVPKSQSPLSFKFLKAKKAALQLEIELVKLKGGTTSG
ncbi:hypothetical protein DFH29DRAFT_880970 [Suillus ampliporus]|nr:hypothetical protein DFH29DRAFT_880970 [Suillus ampliporus]